MGLTYKNNQTHSTAVLSRMLRNAWQDRSNGACFCPSALRRQVSVTEFKPALSLVYRGNVKVHGIVYCLTVVNAR